VGDDHLAGELLPSTDPGQLNVGINLPPGTTLGQTNQLAQNVEKFALAQPEVKTVYSRIGSSTSPYTVPSPSIWWMEPRRTR